MRFRDVIDVFRDLFLEDEKGRLSHTKAWSSIAYAVATWVIVKLTIDGNMTVEYFIWYLVIAGGHSAIAKYINARTSGSYQFPSYERGRGRMGAEKTPIE